MNNYSKLSKTYDAFMTSYDYQEVYNFIEKKLLHLNLFPKRVLEMACGTGSLTEFLSKKYIVDAFDISEEMLSQAYMKLGRNKRVHLYHLDMRNFKLNGNYSVIFCLCDSLNYLKDSKELELTFSSVASHLKTGGYFIFDLNTETRFKEDYQDNNYIFENKEVFCIWENFYDSNTRNNHYDLTFFIKQKDGSYIRQYEHHIEHAFTNKEIKTVLEKYNFEVISIYDGYTDNEELANARRTVWIVKKN